MNLLVDALNALLNPQIIRGEADKVEIADGNETFQIGPGPGGGGIVTTYRLKDVKDDYLVCVSWDGATEGSTQVAIAKSNELRSSLMGETVLGTAYTYTYANGPTETWAAGTAATYNKTRTSNDGTNTEDQRVLRPWVENDVIYAINCLTTGALDGSGNAINQICLLPSRYWARKSAV